MKEQCRAPQCLVNKGSSLENPSNISQIYNVSYNNIKKEMFRMFMNSKKQWNGESVKYTLLERRY